MMLAGMKTCPALLWGLCVVFVVEATTVSTPKTGAHSTSEQLTTVIPSDRASQAVTQGPMQILTEFNAAAATGGRMSHSKETEKNQAASVPTQSPRSSGSAVSFPVAHTASAQLRHLLTSATATDKETQTSLLTTNMDGAGQSSRAPTTMTTPATSAASSSPTEFRKTTVFSRTIPSHDEPTVSTQSSPPTPTAATEMKSHTSEAAPVSDTASPPAVITETRVSTELPSASPSAAGVPTTSSRTPGPGPNAALTSSESATSTTSAISTSAFSTPAFSTSAFSTSALSTADASTSPAGIFIPIQPKNKPQPPTRPTAATTTRAVSKSTPAPEVQPSPTHKVVKPCLIIIALLALLATIFIVTTIVLCTKLSARKCRLKRQEGTEMMCISSLLPERNYTYRRQRNPISNGVLVIPRGADSDEEGGDNVTLSSFFPENDHYV